MMIFGWIAIGMWLVCNVTVAWLMNAEEMREQFITEQNWVGKIGANSFYSLAWAIKGVR